MKSLIILALVFASNALAGTIIPSLEPAKVKAHLPSKTKGQCTDFSGKWAGTCTDPSGTHPAAVVITQLNCANIYYDSVYYPIEGVHQVQDVTAGSSYVIQSTTQLKWEANNTYLAFVTDFSIIETGNGVLYADEIKGGSTLKNGKLFSTAKGHYGETSCVLEKQ